MSLSKITEVRSQLLAGKELLQASGAALGGRLEYVWVLTDNNLSATELARRQRNLQEAIRARETVLLLDPDHREAKIALATCFRRVLGNRTAEARNLYRELIETPVADQWSEIARQALVDSFRWSGGEEKKRWFDAGLNSTASKSAAAFYREQAGTAAEDVAIEDGRGSEAQLVAEKRLFEAIRSNKHVMSGKYGEVHRPDFGMETYLRAFGTNRTAGVQQLSALVPRMKEECPELMPHLLAVLMSFQDDTNAAVIKEFQAAVKACTERPEQVFKIKDFWEKITGSVWEWAYDRKYYDLAASLLERARHAAGKDQAVFGDRQKISLAFTYNRQERWGDALEIFQSYSRRPIEIGSGPWGRAFSPVLTSRLADQCREKLGLPIVRDPREFEMGTNCLCLHTPSAFLADVNGLWVCIDDQLIRLDFDLKTNYVVTLPSGGYAPVTALCSGKSNIWIGTGGAGLIEYDKTSRQCRRLTIKDGLMMDSITTLLVSEDALWIGYGTGDFSGGGGGLGRLELGTRTFKSFTLSLAGGLEVLRRPTGNLTIEQSDQPTRRSIKSLAFGPDGDVCFSAASHPLRRYRQRNDLWLAGPLASGTCMAADAKRLYSGGGEWNTGMGLNVWEFDSNKVWNFKAAHGLPSQTVSTLCLDGQDLWIGGFGFVALADTDSANVCKFAYVPAETVDQIQIGGGYVWAKYDGHLHRNRLQSLR